MLGLVDIDASVPLIVESARNWFMMRRRMMLFLWFQIILQIFIKETSRIILWNFRGLKRLQRSFDDFSDFHLKRILEVHKFRVNTIVNFCLEGLIIDRDLSFRTMLWFVIQVLMHICVLLWILIFLLMFIFINSLELFSQHFNFRLQLYVFISELK